jgi:hypothetical protein
MDISSGDISAMVFKRVLRDDLGEFSLDGQMLGILMELNGTASVGEIANKSGLNMGAMREIISKLMQLQLIEPVEAAVSMLDGDFFDYLRAELALAVGPISEVLIEDAVADLGHSLSQFPKHRAAELIDLIDRQIQREEKRITFKQNMVQKIREQG